MDIAINGRVIGPEHAPYIVAEMSANHNKDFSRAMEIIKAAQEAGADAVKLQTYTPDTITIDCDNKYFRIKGTPWQGKKLYELYEEAYTPWDWQPELMRVANDLGLDFFSTPFDGSAVDFLEKMKVPAYKVASFEIVDIPLLRKIARTGKPIILSTGMATLDEIRESVKTVMDEGNRKIALLRCVSAYPAPPDEMNLRTIPHLAKTFGVPVGISDHTLGVAVAVAAVSLGACIVEKHLTLSRSDIGPDSAFSLEPLEFKEMVKEVRTAERAIGKVCYDVTDGQKPSLAFRRSLFVVKDMMAGEAFTEENVRAIRPGHGLHTRELERVLGKKAKTDIRMGTPLDWKMIRQ